MTSWNFKDLKYWDDKICDIASGYGLDWFEIKYEVCDYYEMIGHMSYHGMPSHYNHWSFGKSFERTHQMYNLGMEGLPYELIINSDPSIAYLMKQNDLFLQILIMAHCVGHSDFFKNNRMFKDTRPENVVSRFRNAKKRIQEYSENTSIGSDKVENFLDALHTIKYQTNRTGNRRETKAEIKNSLIKQFNQRKKSKIKSKGVNLKRKKTKLDLSKSLLKADHDLLSFLIEYGTHFEDWQLDILNIVRDNSQYFMPQINTKILNEGWASFWHYKIIHDLELPQEYHIPFMKLHNLVVRPHLGRINPYHVGFYIFNKIEKEMGLDECFLIREVHDDVAALRFYLDIKDYRELNFFSFSQKKKGHMSVDDVSDEEGFKEIQKNLIMNTGVNSIPHIYVSDIDLNGNLVLTHNHDGRDLELNYASEVMESIKQLWPKDIKLFTIIEDELWEM